MYKPFAVINGLLISLMILSNGLMTEVLTNTPAVLLIHLTGLVCIGSVILVTRQKWISLKGIPVFYLLGGLTGLATVYITNISFIALGATVTLMLSMIGQIATSTVIDHYGLMGMKKHPFHPAKLIGLTLMMLGLMLIVSY